VAPGRSVHVSVQQSSIPRELNSPPSHSSPESSLPFPHKLVGVGADKQEDTFTQGI